MEGYARIINEIGLEGNYYKDCIRAIAYILPLLSYTQRGIPTFADHGPQHSIRILRYLKAILNNISVTLTQKEKSVLALAAFCHDLGCIVERKNHADKSVELLDSDQFEFIRYDLGAEIVDYLREVIRVHSRKVSLDTVPTTGRLRLLCALFSLADACDIASDKVHKSVFKILNDYEKLDSFSIKVWEAHFAILNVRIDGQYIRPQVYSMAEAEICLGSLQAELNRIEETMKFYSLPNFVLDPQEIA